MYKIKQTKAMKRCADTFESCKRRKTDATVFLTFEEENEMSRDEYKKQLTVQMQDFKITSCEDEKKKKVLVGERKKCKASFYVKRLQKKKLQELKLCRDLKLFSMKEKKEKNDVKANQNFKNYI